jgi:uncharacterized delta-60 repeat protein
MKQARPRIGISARALPALATCAIALALPSLAQARPGDLDRSFSRDGRVMTQFVPRGDEGAYAVAVQRNGRIVAVGIAGYSSYDSALARYLPGGSLDPSFGDGGRVTADLGPTDTLSDVAIDARGRIVVVGRSESLDGDSAELVVARFTADGELDGSFAIGGVRKLDLAGDAAAEALELERDGGVVLAGWTQASSGEADFAVVKLTPEGERDQAFANRGVKVIRTRRRDGASSLDVDRYGRITVGGTATSGHASFARLKPSGRLDRSFSGNGRKILKRLRDYDEVSGIAVRPSGSVVVAGTNYRWDPDELDMFLARIRPDGSLNRSFGHRGRRAMDFSPIDRASDLVLQADGKIIVTGTADYRLAVVRVTRRGRLDSTFSGNGRTLTTFHRSGGYGQGVTLQPNGKIVAAGIGEFDYEDDENKFALARYKNDGRPAGR